MKAKIERLLCHYNYIMTFHYSVNEGDMISVVQTNLDIAITRLNNDFDSYIAEHDPSLVSGAKAGNASNHNSVQVVQAPAKFTLEHY